MDIRGFQWITAATAVVAALGAATSLAIAAANPGASSVAGPGSVGVLIALPASVSMHTPKI
jgi:hypothetical protein